MCPRKARTAAPRHVCAGGRGPRSPEARWTEIVDNVSIYAYLDEDLVVLFEFGRDDHPVPEDLGEVFAARLPPERFLAIVEEATDLLDADGAAPR